MIGKSPMAGRAAQPPDPRRGPSCRQPLGRRSHSQHRHRIEARRELLVGRWEMCGNRTAVWNMAMTLTCLPDYRCTVERQWRIKRTLNFVPDGCLLGRCWLQGERSKCPPPLPWRLRPPSSRAAASRPCVQSNTTFSSYLPMKGPHFDCLKYAA